MTERKLLRLAMALVPVVFVAAAWSHPWDRAHESRLTFETPVSLPGVVLPPGSYSFDLADSKSTLDVVVVRTIDRAKVLFVGFTNAVPRPSELTDTPVVFGEMSRNQPSPIAVWYETGSTEGHQFLYR